MWGYHDGMGWWFVFGAVWMVVFWGIIIGLVIWGVGRITSGGRRDDSSGEETALDIARKRLARGEIDRDEFDELSALLR